MNNNLSKKALAITLTLSIIVANRSSHAHAADLVAIPQNVRTPILTPAPTQTRSTELSFKSFEAKISNVFKREKTKPRLAATYSGACGTGVTYNLDTTAGVLTISGAGAMTDYSSSSAPWYSYRSSIKTVVIENGVTYIGSYAFSNCYALTEVSIPDSVTSIGVGAFYSCNALTEVSIPDFVTSIGSNAFRYCFSLTEVSIPDSVTYIGSYAFSDCSSLTEVSIPDSVTTIGDSAFLDCKALTSITVDSSNSNYKSINGVLFNNAVTTLIQYPAGKSGGYTIPDSVTSIGVGAFYDCDALTSVSIPDSVTTIGSSAFSYCDALTSVSIPDSVTSISSCAFTYCYALTEVSIPDSVTTIGDRAFYSCDALTSVSIPDSVTTIGEFAFRDCSGLTSVSYAGTTEQNFGSSAFIGCKRLKEVKVPIEYENSTFCNIPVDKCLATVLCKDEKQYLDTNSKKLVICGKTIKKPTNVCKYQPRNFHIMF